MSWIYKYIASNDVDSSGKILKWVTVTDGTNERIVFLAFDEEPTDEEFMTLVNKNCVELDFITQPPVEPEDAS